MTDTTVEDEAMRWTVIGFLIVWSSVVLVSVSMFYRSKATLPIRTRGLALTLLLTLTQYLMVVWIILQPILNLPCTLTLWLTGLLLPLWSATLLARFLRIMFLHRINQFNLSNSLLDIASNDYKQLPHTNFDSVLKPVTSGGGSSKSNKNFPHLDQWLLRNRGWFGSKGLTIVLFGWLFFHIVITLMIQVVSTYIKSDINECIRLWQLYPSLFITLLTLIMEWPVLIILFRDMQESFGIKLELVVNLFLAPAFLTCQVVALVLNGYDPTVLLIVKFVATIFVCSMHLLSVGYPLWWARHEFVLFEKVKSLYASKELHRKQLLDDYKAANKNKPTDATDTTPTTPTNNKPTLDSVLENKLLFADFKMFAAHNFCVENVLFYERYTLLKKWEEMEAARNEGRITVKATNQSQPTVPCTATPPIRKEAGTKESNANLHISPALSIYETSSIPLEALYETQYLDMYNDNISQTLTPSNSVGNPNQYFHHNHQPSYTRQSYTNQTRINDPIINCATAQTPIQTEILNLYNDFLAPESSLQLNLTGTLKKQLVEQLQKGIFNSEIYLPVYNEVYFLLSQDVFPRYLKSLEKSNN